MTIGIKECACCASGSMAVVEGNRLDDEGMSLVLTLFLDAICKKRM